MRIVPFSGQREEVAALAGRPEDEVSQALAEGASWIPRWLAVDGDTVVAGARVLERPDERRFLSVMGDWSALPSLAATIGPELGVALHLMADRADVARIEAARRAGFEVEVEVEGFLVRFDAALATVRRAFVPAGVRIVSVLDVSETAAFRLDNELRQDVPGTDGWRGNRSWFHDEITADPAFDPAAYLVSLDPVGRPSGLIRFWRNPDRPRLGLIGVRRAHRGGVLAAALLRAGLEAASGWGSEVFATETSLSNDAVHPRLTRLADSQEGVSVQFVRPAPDPPAR